MIDIAVTVNGTRYERRVPPRLLLSDFIRHELKLYGTHVGCEHGVCGACTVLLDGRPARSCLTLAVQADGHELAANLCRCTGYAPIVDSILAAAERLRG